MLMVLVGALVSFAIASFAMTIMLREFQAHWSQIVAALYFGSPHRQVAPAALRQPVALRQRWPAPVRLHSPRRAAA